VATASDRELEDALVCYEVARLTFRSLVNSIAHRLAAGELLTDTEILAEQEARTAILAARGRVLAAFAVRDPATLGARTDNVIEGLLRESLRLRDARVD
jgi:hypothetical protein